MLQHDLMDYSRIAGSDGASAQVRPAPRQEDEFEDESQQLLHAWSIERARAVEAELLLNRARDLIVRSVVPGKAPSLTALRQARRLLGEIDRQRESGRTA